MANEHTEHQVDEGDIAVVEKVIASDHMPATMAIVTFSPFADVDRQLHLQADLFPDWLGATDQIRILLVMIVFVGRTLIHRIRKYIADKARKVVALNQAL